MPAPCTGVLVSDTAGLGMSATSPPLYTQGAEWAPVQGRLGGHSTSWPGRSGATLASSVRASRARASGHLLTVTSGCLRRTVTHPASQDHTFKRYFTSGSMRALAVICLAALLGCSRSRPSSSSFLFPDELPAFRNVSDKVRNTLVTSNIPTVRRLKLTEQSLAESHSSESEEITTEIHSGNKAQASVSSFSTEAHDSSELDTAAVVFRQPAGSSPGQATTDIWKLDRSLKHTTARNARPRFNASGDVPEESVPRAATSGSRLTAGDHPATYPDGGQPALGAGELTTQGRAFTSGSILFPDSAATGPVRPLPSCDGRTVSAVDPATGLCQMLALAGGCADGQLFLLSADGAEAGCRPLPCPEHQLMVGDGCVSAEDPAACPSNMVLVRDERGGGRCDCRPGHVLWPADGHCYPALTQGPCPVGQQLTAPLDEARPRCADNPCVLDGSWLLLRPPVAGCFQLLHPEEGCESQLMLALEHGKLACVPDLMVRSIFVLPSVRCGDSELMDYGGRCRDPLRHGFRQ